MLEGRRKEEWIHTASVICTLVNSQRSKGPPIKFSEIYPFKDETESRSSKSDIAEMRAVCKEAFGEK